jgi:hypothetical protein
MQFISVSLQTQVFIPIKHQFEACKKSKPQDNCVFANLDFEQQRSRWGLIDKHQFGFAEKHKKSNAADTQQLAHSEKCNK